jgi:hypothetical protein
MILQARQPDLQVIGQACSAPTMALTGDRATRCGLLTAGTRYALASFVRHLARDVEFSAGPWRDGMRVGPLPAVRTVRGILAKTHDHAIGVGLTSLSWRRDRTGLNFRPRHRMGS